MLLPHPGHCGLPPPAPVALADMLDSSTAADPVNAVGVSICVHACFDSRTSPCMDDIT